MGTSPLHLHFTVHTSLARQNAYSSPPPPSPCLLLPSPSLHLSSLSSFSLKQCNQGCHNFHNQPCAGNGFSTSPAFVASSCVSTSIWMSRTDAAKPPPLVPVKFSNGATNASLPLRQQRAPSPSPAARRSPRRTTPRTATRTAAASSSSTSLALGAPTQRLVQSLQSATVSTSFSASTCERPPWCQIRAAALDRPQAYACTLPALTNAALLGKPLAVRVKWPQDTTVQYLAELAGRIPTNVTAVQTTNAISEATVSYSCVNRTCDCDGCTARRVDQMQGLQEADGGRTMPQRLQT